MVSIKDAVASMAYSYSRISLFQQCPFKWLKSYVEKYPEPGQTFFDVGHICHGVAEDCALWVIRENFVNKLVAYSRIGSNNSTEVSRELAYSMYSGKAELFGGYDSKFELETEMSSKLDYGDYDIASMPEKAKYDEFFDKAVAKVGTTDPSTIEDARNIMNRYYDWKDFTVMKDDIMMAERRVGFKEDWSLTKFFSDDAYFRLVIDNIIYSDRTVIITDYKSSRKMLTEKEIRNDYQLMCYALAVKEMLPDGSFDNMIVRHEYMRFRTEVEYTVEDIEAYTSKAKAWIASSIVEINAASREGREAFKPKRNENCGSCHLREDGACPLFLSSANLGAYDHRVSDEKSCANMWKHAESLDAERKSLVKQCKDFIKDSETSVMVDSERAKLGFYTEEKVGYNVFEFFRTLKSKGITEDKIVSFLSLSDANFKKAMKYLKVSLSDDELGLISYPKYSTKFEAYTEKEANKFINL